MMLYAQGPARQSCSLLAVFCGEVTGNTRQRVEKDSTSYPFPELVSSGRLEVQILTNPTPEEFRRVLEYSESSFVYLQGQLISNEEEVSSLVWGDVDLSSAEAISELFVSALPTTVYLEIPNGENLAKAIHSKGVPYVIYWKNTFSCFAACHFRQALFSVVQSSCSHTWDAFQLAHASFRLYCICNSNVLPGSFQKDNDKFMPLLLGNPPEINIIHPVKEVAEEEEGSPSATSIRIYDDDVTMRFLICGVSCTLDACLLGSLEDGLNALLNIEIRGCKLHNRISATPPPLQAETFSRGVVTMRCDLSTCSSAHISLLVSGSAQTCFDDQLLESHIKKELVERSQLVHALPICEKSKPSLAEPRKSASIACGATTFEVCMKVPLWASQVLKQLAPEVSYRSFVTLGIASIQGLSVASFDNDDAERLLFFCSRQGKETVTKDAMFCRAPVWFRMPVPCIRRMETFQEKALLSNCTDDKKGMRIPKLDPSCKKESGSLERMKIPLVPVRQKLKVAAMRPIPHTGNHKMLPFLGVPETNGYDSTQGKVNTPVIPAPKHNLGTPAPVTQRKSSASSFQAQQIISLNPLPLKKHGCGRSPIQVCSEEEFLRDVMQFLILRGHSRLIPPGGLAEFPDAILNAKRLDLYNLYREVVSRGGFHVGNGINWKGQVFSKMRNHTMANRMTGVGNTLKRHYETYLLEYELAHDDVDGECCLLCHSSAAGDWVNCGICGEWAHFGCDRRHGLGAFKDYAKTDGLEYICPHCSLTTLRKKSQKMANGYPQSSAV